MKSLKDKTFQNSVIIITVLQIAIVLIAVFAVPLLRKPTINSVNFNIQTVNLRTLLITFAGIKLTSLLIIIAMPLKWGVENEDKIYTEFEYPKPIISALLYLYTFLWFVICTFIVYKTAVEIIVFNSLYTACCHIALVVRANKNRMRLVFCKQSANIIIGGFITLYIGITVLSILKLIGIFETVSIAIGGTVLFVLFFALLIIILYLQRKKVNV